MEVTLFDGWNPILRVLIVGPLAYTSMVILLRVSGKRTLSKMNAFDLVVTISLGSVLATILTDRTLALLTGVTVIAVLIACQFVITALSVRLPAVERFVKAEPSLLVRNSRLLPEAMRRSRVTEREVVAAVREAGVASLSDVAEAVLETDGSVTVVPASARSKD
jgi:uncharacterized membrane protein YcaP (DUF421 family)